MRIFEQGQYYLNEILEEQSQFFTQYIDLFDVFLDPWIPPLTPGRSFRLWCS
jgi:hypothetical protein